MVKTIIALGGGEIKNKTTLPIDEYISALAKCRAGEKRAYGLFLGAASHDSMPYFNSFRKTYTSVFDMKADVALTVYGEMNYERISEKFEKADMLYLGGGDTKFMLETYDKACITPLIKNAYERGVVISGLSAGAICYFDKMYSDCDIMSGECGEYKVMDGLGWVKGLCCPHYNERQKDFDEAFMLERYESAYAIENDCALVFTDGELKGSVTAGGKAYILRKNGECLEKEIIKEIV